MFCFLGAFSNSKGFLGSPVFVFEILPDSQFTYSSFFEIPRHPCLEYLVFGVTCYISLGI